MLRPVPCPDENELVRFARGSLPARDVHSVAGHVDLCDECRRVTAAVALATGAANSSRAPTLLAKGDQLGRYEIEGVLGAGAMGVVYAAHDTQLRRRVALKVIHPALPFDLAPEEARARILREAQSMAKLSHPNVVSVFELGAHGDELFVAMELSDGVTLEVWRATGPRSLREILHVFQEAGKGLAAAHRAGVVHRDFKPQNVLIDRSGRVRVSDFGLSRYEPTLNPSLTANDGPIDATRTGLLLGTPGYMAPEQFDGRADARSDQFAFAVALYEACTGTRPFHGATLAELRTALQNQPLPRRPGGLPRWLHGTLSRALSVRPEDRFSSMDELLRAIDSGAARHKRTTRALIAAGAAVLIAAISAGIYESNRAAAKSGSSPDRSVYLVSGEWTELRLPGVSRLALSAPEVAAVESVGDDRVQIIGETPGRTSLRSWDQQGHRTEISVHVLPKHIDPAQDGGPVLRLVPGQRHVLTLGDVSRLALGDSTIAEARVTPAGEVEVKGLGAGMTTLLVWLRDGARRTLLLQVSDPASGRPPDEGTRNPHQLP